ncbi:DUF4352 domain-containing protein [Enterococcus faecalis]|uniref:DUF4352 domain-containing protein n=1 Tax=Enterococcus faecalis TaxID=1351 RepID=UPI00032DF93A|nr:DUF4352 domain-containing protein [Enterococcus faecalis]EGO2676742.1 DUF4352 domain-containing protein [Enterococcus faecalis]EGO2846137.1 DUF4352 domain-containing protein [Enterococcus faecalis]EGO5240040.1 DUF4352 domain-containing protein [Enterococcus faecalis]EGO7804622.1 DUF4352 domain-containing protein [Enterococcus faecalis]EGO8303691.1 DUF4352 domain-containing protein [Enterococcus faecalis]
MSKKVMGQDGKTYKVKKPFYKRVWFWILAVILIVIIGSALNGGSDSNKASDNGGEKVTKSSTSASSSKEEKSDTFYKIGDTVKVGDAEYTLNSVELTDERNQFEENQPAQIVKITYTVKNDGDSDIPVGMDVEVYGSDNKKSETYPNDNTMGSVAPGKEMDCVAHFGLNQTGEIEIHFSPLVSFEKAAKYKVPV